MPVRAVLFDLGDTLIFQAHEPDRPALFAKMADQVQPVLDSWGLKLSSTLADLLNDISAAVHTAQPGRRARGFEVDGAFISRGALAAYGVDISREQAKEFWLATEVGLAAWGAQAYPDTIDTLVHARALGMTAALVSNTTGYSEMVRKSLDSAGIGVELLPVIVTSADLMRPKPRPEPFELALQQLDIEAQDAVFVGDDLEADMRGAKPLGMTTVWKLNGRHEVDPEPEVDFMIHDLGELFTLDLLPADTGAAMSQESLMPHEDANADRY